MKKRLLVVTGMVAAVIAVALPARAADQVVDANLASVLQMTTSPTASVSGWNLAGTGGNTTSGGSIGVNANQPWTISVTADKTKMTEYVTASAAYVSPSPKSLTTGLSIQPTRTGGTAVVPGVGATATTGSSTLLATGTGLGTDDFNITLSQPTLIVDPALVAGRTYHIVLTYTLSSTL